MSRIDEKYMQESLRAFIEETLPDSGIGTPKIFIIIAASKDDIVFSTTSNNHNTTLMTLARAIALWGVNADERG